MECASCKRANYHTFKNKKKIKERLLLRKHCPWCGKHTEHKETK
jgi:large subunit ribosomal protein L33